MKYYIIYFNKCLLFQNILCFFKIKNIVFSGGKNSCFLPRHLKIKFYTCNSNTVIFLSKVIILWESHTAPCIVVSSSLGPAGIVGGGSECTALSPSSIPRRGALWARHRTPPTAPRAPQHKWLPTAPGVCSRCVCVHCCVCVHFGWVNCRAQIPSMGHHTWPYATSLSFSYEE